ncbi:MAG TPA: hypothetical protein PK728_04125 [Bacillota bacterium]|nr:hypothetical protein [Bacillota bacterium]
MEDSKRQVIVLSLVEKMKEQGSWCGETHIQKSLYFLQEMLKVPTDFDFVLYKHRPFSFDLRDELVVMRGNMLLELHSNPYPYGPSHSPGPSAEKLKELYPKTAKKYEPQISFVAEKLSGLNVAGLERLATALYVTLGEGEGRSIKSRANLLTN